MPEGELHDYTPPAPTLERSPGHWEEWARAIQGGPKAGAHFQIAGLVTESVLLGNAALRAGHKLEWDAAAMAFKNDPAATAFLSREYRKGWTL
jgi:hypothetical protein